MLTDQSLRDLITSGIELTSGEAVAIAQELITCIPIDDRPEPPFGPPTLDNVRVYPDGSVGCRACGTTPAVSEIGRLLDAMLPRGAKTRVPGGLRYTIARALLEVDAPPFDSLTALSTALARHEQGDRSDVVGQLCARAVPPAPPVAVPAQAVGFGKERRRGAASATELRRHLRQADEALFYKRQSTREAVPVPAALPKVEPRPALSKVEPRPALSKAEPRPVLPNVVRPRTVQPRAAAFSPSKTGKVDRSRLQRWGLAGAAAALVAFGAGYEVVAHLNGANRRLSSSWSAASATTPRTAQRSGVPGPSGGDGRPPAPDQSAMNTTSPAATADGRIGAATLANGASSSGPLPAAPVDRAQDASGPAASAPSAAAPTPAAPVSPMPMPLPSAAATSPASAASNASGSGTPRAAEGSHPDAASLPVPTPATVPSAPSREGVTSSEPIDAPPTSASRRTAPAMASASPSTAGARPGYGSPSAPAPGSGSPSASAPTADRQIAPSRGASVVRAVAASSGATFSPSFASTGTALFFHTGKSTDAHSSLEATDLTGADDLRVMTIVDDGAKNYHVRPSPDGKRVAFDSDRDGERGVYIAYRDGSGARRVSGPGFAAVPTWSPDGRTLAYIRAEADRPRVWNLWLQDLDSGQARRLTSFTYGQTWSASWFPDGRRILYAHEDRLIIRNLDSGATHEYASPVSRSLVRTPAVSPDGRHVIFQVFRSGAWLLDLNDGSMKCVLTDPSAEEFAWSPDGRRVAFHSRRDGQWGIWLMAPA